MTEDSCPRVSSSESDSSTTKQRKRRKWDQPDESLVSAGVAVPGIFPLANMGSLASITLPIVSSVTGASLAIPFSTSSATPLQVVTMPLQQHAAAIVQKLVQPKIQDELIAREIVINDADSAIRYKLTKRQTQEEIQKSTGAVLETTADRIKAVDHAAAMVEEMLKQATVSSGAKVDHLFSTCVYLGFEADSSLDIISRIRGPNDQYVNHIMNETGATVLLRGRGSGYSENGQTEETQPPLHLLLSSNDPKSLQHAKLLAENLLDTICAESGATRVSSCKVYGAVPPPPQLQAGVQIPSNASKVNDTAAFSSTVSAGVSSGPSHAPLSQSIGVSNSGLPQANTACYPHGLTSGTSYNGYGGIYPQATPLQQVALALRHSTSPVTATVDPATTASSTDPQKEVPHLAKDKRSQKRKFQELPAATKGPANPNQVFSLTFYEAYRLIMDLYVGNLYVSQGAKGISVVQDPKRLVKPSSNGMPPPPPRRLSPPSLPPKFNSTPKVHEDSNGMHRSKSEVVPDTLVKLMEYGDDDDVDDDLEETAKQSFETHSSASATPKPFWAV
ncbi:hypothetical protein DH2020_037096 [Rehmannia glutinosa]|uniref:Uncharacterized protein n=1 Tax=Rehmannia glutinosa TaxID=99300 RepID=A0ABR0V4F8_REHGL